MRFTCILFLLISFLSINSHSSTLNIWTDAEFSQIGTQNNTIVSTLSKINSVLNQTDNRLNDVFRLLNFYKNDTNRWSGKPNVYYSKDFMPAVMKSSLNIVSLYRNRLNVLDADYKKIMASKKSLDDLYFKSTQFTTNTDRNEVNTTKGAIISMMYDLESRTNGLLTDTGNLLKETYLAFDYSIRSTLNVYYYLGGDQKNLVKDAVAQVAKAEQTGLINAQESTLFKNFYTKLQTLASNGQDKFSVAGRNSQLRTEELAAIYLILQKAGLVSNTEVSKSIFKLVILSLFEGDANVHMMYPHMISQNLRFDVKDIASFNARISDFIKYVLESLYGKAPYPAELRGRIGNSITALIELFDQNISIVNTNPWVPVSATVPNWKVTISNSVNLDRLIVVTAAPAVPVQLNFLDTTKLIHTLLNANARKATGSKIPFDQAVTNQMTSLTEYMAKEEFQQNKTYDQLQIWRNYWKGSEAKMPGYSLTGFFRVNKTQGLDGAARDCLSQLGDDVRSIAMNNATFNVNMFTVLAQKTMDGKVYTDQKNYCGLVVKIKQ